METVNRAYFDAYLDAWNAHEELLTQLGILPTAPSQPG